MKEIIILFALVGVTAWACKKDSYMEERDVLGTAVAAATFSVSDLEGAISQAEARLLVHTFKQNIGMPSGGPVTRSVWFSIGEIHLIDSLMQEERRNGIGTDGLRVLFGQYPLSDLNGQPYKHPGQNTVIFVSTKSDTTLLGTVYHENYFDHEEDSIAFNRGEQCQPYCDGADEGL